MGACTCRRTSPWTTPPSATCWCTTAPPISSPPAPTGCVATLLPFVSTDVGERGALLGHVARNNDHWRRRTAARRWSSSAVRTPTSRRPGTRRKAEHGRVVPTWNYVTAHVLRRWSRARRPGLGRGARARRSPTSTRRAAPRRGRSTTPRRFFAGQLRAIVGVELADQADRGEVQAQPEPPRRPTSTASSPGCVPRGPREGGGRASGEHPG